MLIKVNQLNTIIFWGGGGVEKDCAFYLMMVIDLIGHIFL